jgi:hypothetical protein
MTPDPALSAITKASTSLRQAESELDAAVTNARAAGLSWAQIGAALGVSRQSAHERWGHLARGGCQRRDCDCPSHDPSHCPCGHGPGKGRTAS